MNVIAASLFARFTSRQDDSPAMKAIAAMRNQFGGHAVRTEPPAGGDANPARPDRPSVYVAHLLLHDFRSYADRRRRARARASRRSSAATGRARPTWSRRSTTSPGSPRTGSSADAPLVRAGAEQAVVRAAVVRDGRTAVLEVELNPGRSNRARINRSPLPRARELVGLVRTVVFSPEDLTLVKGDPSRPAPVPRRPAGAAHPAAGRRARRLRPGPAGSATPCSRPPAPRAAAVVEPGGRALDARRVGRPPRPDRRRAARRAARARRRAAALRRQGVRDRRPRRDARRRRHRVPAVVRPRGPHRARRPGRGAARRGRASPQRRARPRHLAGRAAPRRAAAQPRARPDRGPGCRSRATPRTGSPGRSRSRCGWRRTTCCAPTATTRS